MRWVRLGGLRFPSTFASLEILMMKTVMTLCVLSTVLSAALSFAAGDPPPDTTRVVIRGVDRVVDGWVRTDGTASFSEPTLSGHGRAWSAYDHILMRFDLSSVDAMRFARVRKAVLRLHVLQAKNPQRKVPQVAPAVTRWNTRATALSPLGDKTGWPQRAGFANIQYTMRKELQTGRVICKAGVVEFEITEVLARWLYHGMPNRGLMVSASPAIFGAPDQGSWSLLCAASEAKESLRPALIIDMEGQVPLPEEAEQRALALYPSAALAPVKDPYYMVYYNAGSRQQWRRLPTINMTTYSGQGVWLAPRGVANLSWAEGGPIDWLPTAESYTNYYTNVAKTNTVGFCGHESNLQGAQLDWLVDAFRAAERHFPQRFSAYYYRGEEKMSQAAGDGHIDLLIQEGYTSTHKQFPLRGYAIGIEGIKKRIDTARKFGAIERHVVMLGHICRPENYHPGHALTPEKIDALIGELRRYAPEMPGIGFYGVNGEQLAIACDRLARKHFVEPAPEVTILEPAFEATLTSPHVAVRAEATAKADRQVTVYRWFVDNRLVAETDNPDYVWDLRGERSGHHWITVHAVDDGFNRAATQIPVYVVRPRSGKP